MSRSNPHDNGTPNPAERWFEWNGEHGTVRYYDKERKQSIDVGSDFTFLLLDQLGSVRGWHDASKSGIYSNEVKDTRQETLVVKAFKGGILAEGIYRNIKERVNAQGAHFVANCYIAFKAEDGSVRLGSIRFKGATLRAWMDFTREHRAELFNKAIRIKGYTEDKKGKIVYRVPVFKIADISPQTDADATELDKGLQAYLSAYLKRTKRDQIETAPSFVAEDEDQSTTSGGSYDDDIPFARMPEY